MMYYINDQPLSAYGFQAGWLKDKNSSYALSGFLNLPKRTGETYREWENGIDPFVDSDDIEFESRKLNLSIVSKSDHLLEFNAKLEALYSAFDQPITLRNDKLGSYRVIVEKTSIKHFKNGWGVCALELTEKDPVIDFVELPPENNSPFGINGYSWQQLGLVIKGLKNRYALTDYQENKARKFNSIELEGTLKGESFDDFIRKAKQLQTLFGSEGLKSLNYFDQSSYSVFCTEGFSIEKIRVFDKKHIAEFKCKLIVV